MNRKIELKTLLTMQYRRTKEKENVKERLKDLVNRMRVFISYV